MKKIILISIFALFSLSLSAQNKHLPKTEKKGKLTEVTLYYDNGEIMQHGFYTKSGKLHGGWESYSENGSRKCVAFYDKGVKVGTWYYWNNKKVTKVIYDNNKIVLMEELTDEDQLKSKF